MKSKSECCGCSACEQICPVGCIKMKEDEEGFLYPKIDNMYSVAKSELFKNKFVSNFLSYCNAIPIKRNGKDFAGTMRILRLLKKHDKIRLLSLLYLFI